MLSNLEKRAMDAVDRESLMAITNEIARHERLSGSADELIAFKFIEKKMKEYGFQTSLIHHDAYISLPVSASLKVISPEEISMFCITHSCAVSTPPGGVEAEVMWVGNAPKFEGFGIIPGSKADAGAHESKDANERASAGISDDACGAGPDVRGKFVILEGLAGPDPTVWANEHGALGQIHVNADEHIHDMTVQNVWGSPDDRNTSTLPKTHVVSIAKSDGDRLKALLDKGPVKVRIETKVETRWTKIPLLECTLDGNDGTGDYLLISGHVDSWYYGAMDNGSANATMMEVGRILASLKGGGSDKSDDGAVHRGLKVCFWSGHSHGRYAGSSWYCDNHWQDLNEHCVMHLNVDSTGGIGSTELRYGGIMPETCGIGKWAITETMGIPFEGSRIGRNGDQSFWGIGIPSMFVSVSSQPEGGLGWWWHNPADLPDKVDPELLVRDTKIYVLVAARIVGAEVLPFDYLATMDEWLEVIGKIREKAGKRFDLSEVIGRANALKTMIGELATRKPGASGNSSASSNSAAVKVINECLKKVGRALVSVSFTRTGKFGQDPALNVPSLPDLQDAVRLGALSEGSDEALLLNVRLVRGRNRVLAALSEAMEAVKRAIEAT